MPVPDSVLRADPAHRHQWFRRRVFEHPRMRLVRDQVLDALDLDDVLDPENVLDSDYIPPTVAVSGPTGVGKTTLMSSIARMLSSQLASRAEGPAPPGTMPVVVMECPSSRERGYDFNREHWKCLLIALGDLFVDRHFDPDLAARRRRRGSERPAIGRKSSGSDLRLAAERFMKMRGTQVLLLDEAHHMTRVRGTRVIEEHLDEIKSFGSLTKVRQVLFGTEQLKDLLRGNAQLTRRTKEVFYDAYAYDKPEDRAAFNEIMGKLFTHLPLRNLQTLESHFEYLFTYSAGCVGLLKDWLAAALRLALHAGREHLTVADLEATALSVDRLSVVVDGIEVFRRFARPSADMSEIRAKLGMPTASPLRRVRLALRLRVGVAFLARETHIVIRCLGSRCDVVGSRYAASAWPGRARHPFGRRSVWLRRPSGGCARCAHPSARRRTFPSVLRLLAA